MPVPLLRAAKGQMTEPLPDPYRGLAKSRFGIKFYPGQLMMIAGPPGGGKTMLALHAVMKMGVSCLYFSADSDERTIACRAVAAINSHPLTSIYGAWDRGLFEDIYGGVLRDRVKIKFEFEPTDPSVVDVTNAMEAYLELEGVYPRVVVVDTLTNTESGDANEWGGLRKTAKDLHWLARRTKSLLLVLHHTSEHKMEHVINAPPRSEIQGKISQLPSTILTMATDEGVMWIAAVKNRFGESDPAAKSPLRFVVDLSRVRIWDEPMAVNPNATGSV